MVAVPDDEPPATVMLPVGCAIDGLLLERAMVTPLLGAIPLSVAVATELFPPMRPAGASFKDMRAGACTVRAAVLVELPDVAEIVTEVLAATGREATVNDAVVEPAGIVTLPGTVAAAVLLLERSTFAPPDGAAPLNVTVPFAMLPPNTVAGLNDRDAMLCVGTFCSRMPMVLPVPTAKSISPSRLKSAASRPTADPFAATAVELGKVPSPAPERIVT